MIKELSTMFLSEFPECMSNFFLSRRCAYMSISFIRFHNYSNKLYLLFLINPVGLSKIDLSLSFKNTHEIITFYLQRTFKN